MRTVQEIETEIQELQEQYESVQGTATEVYTRIVGYYRSVNNWNKGKREEYDHRLLFHQPSKEVQEENEYGEEIVSEDIIPVRFTLFYRDTCPNCPPVKSYLEDIALTGDEVNVDTDQGMEAAAKYQVFAAPTVIFFDKEEKEIARIHNVPSMKKLNLPVMAKG